MKTELVRSDHPNALQHAVDILRNGGLVAFPTDTVYGLAAFPLNNDYIEGLFTAKGRSSDRAIAVLIGDAADLSKVAIHPNENAIRLAQTFWPGPITLIVPRHPRLPDSLATLPTIGVRIPDHPVAIALLRLSGPLAVTSANLSGKENTSTAQEVMQQLDGRVHLVLDGGRTPGGVPSTVVDCTRPDPVILRPGPIKQEDIQRVVQGG